MRSSVTVDEVEASLSQPGEVDLEAYAAKVRHVLQDGALSMQPRVHLAVAKGYHDLKGYKNAIRFAEQAIALSETAANGLEASRILEWSYLVKAECLRKLNRRFAELRMLVQYNRTYGNREDFRLQADALLQLYSTRLHAWTIIVFPICIVGVVIMHRLFGWFASPILYSSILLPFVAIASWAALHSRSFKQFSARLLRG